jgi:histidinol-phosphate/aromatic aminotransferase/cobyric acid decarboxylase-like protein
MFNPNPHGLKKAKTKLTASAEKSHYYPTPCTALRGEAGIIIKSTLKFTFLCKTA